MVLFSRAEGKFRALAKSLLFREASPRKLALTIALGVVIGILPLFWGTTLLCALLAYLFRLNQAAIQAANYLAFPLQTTLIVPFYRLGAQIFPWGPPASAEEMVKQLGSNWGKEAALVLVATLKALAAWLLVAVPAAGLLYLLVLLIVARILPAGDTTSEPRVVMS
jgi:uncharacterized protein (DUF2062 family)